MVAFLFEFRAQGATVKHLHHNRGSTTVQAYGNIDRGQSLRC